MAKIKRNDVPDWDEIKIDQGTFDNHPFSVFFNNEYLGEANLFYVVKGDKDTMPSIEIFGDLQIQRDTKEVKRNGRKRKGKVGTKK